MVHAYYTRCLFFDAASETMVPTGTFDSSEGLVSFFQQITGLRIHEIPTSSPKYTHVYSCCLAQPSSISEYLPSKPYFSENITELNFILAALGDEYLFIPLIGDLSQIWQDQLCQFGDVFAFEQDNLAGFFRELATAASCIQKVKEEAV